MAAPDFEMQACNFSLGPATHAICACGCGMQSGAVCKSDTGSGTSEAKFIQGLYSLCYWNHRRKYAAEMARKDCCYFALETEGEREI